MAIMPQRYEIILTRANKKRQSRKTAAVLSLVVNKLYYRDSYLQSVVVFVYVFNNAAL